jgi:hypothetical protein
LFIYACDADAAVDAKKKSSSLPEEVLKSICSTRAKEQTGGMNKNGTKISHITSMNECFEQNKAECLILHKDKLNFD